MIDGLTVDGHMDALQSSDTTRTARLVRSAVTAGQGVGQVIDGLRQTVFPARKKLYWAPRGLSTPTLRQLFWTM